MKLTFLNAATPLTKSYTKLADGSIEKTSYPNVWEVSSIEENVLDLKGFELAITKHAALGNCLLKGNVMRPLVKESRKDSTDRNATTEFLCLDIDGIEPTFTTTVTRPNPVTGQMEDVTSTINVTTDLILESLGLKDVSYIVQWSGSMGIGNNTLRCHIFIMLSKPVSAPLIKQWLIQKNHEVSVLRAHQALTKTGNSLTWGLDITACQSDKLIYIAPPTLKGIKNPLGRTPRISLVTRSQSTFDLTGKINSTDQNRALTDARVLELRDRDGLPKRKLTYKHIGGHEVLNKPGECIATEIKTDRGFVYFNLNGGDSWAYFHPENNPDYIFNFKGEPVYLTKELLPAYWETLSHQAYRVASNGLTYLAFLNKATSTYYRGTYDPIDDVLDIYPAKNESMVRQFADSNGLRLGPNIPEWTMEFNPSNGVRVDFDNCVVNTFERTSYMKAPAKKVTKCPPKTFSIISHILCNDVEAIEHFMNWLAVLAQNLDRTRTAWVFQGTQGCLAAETTLQFKRGKRNSGRPMTVKQAFELWTGQNKGPNNKGWDMSLPTFTKSVRDGMTIGYHEVYKIVESGVKQLFTVTTDSGQTIRITELHPFMRPDGSFTPLKDLRPGDTVVLEGEPLQHVADPQGRQERHTTYSIPHHMYAWKHMIAGKDYQRSHTARLIVEADMNHMSLAEFIDILRNDALKAVQLKYLGFDRIVHHIDGNPANNDLANLAVIDKANHDEHHAKEVGLGSISTKTSHIASITPGPEEMTYDIIMKAPYHNYIANGFAVHNTGKGILFERVLAPLFGQTQTVIKRSAELNEKWTDFVEGKFIVFIDEIQTSALHDEAGAIANLKSLITNPTAMIRAMNRNSYPVNNYTCWLFASNKADPVSIPRNDRRFNVGPYQSIPFPKPTDEWLDSLATDELQNFHHYLLSYPADKEMAATPLNNEARNTLIELSQTTSESTADAIRDGNIQFFLDQLPTSDAYKTDSKLLAKVELYRRALCDILNRSKPNAPHHLRRDEVFAIFDYTVGGMSPSPATFTRFLGHRQLVIKPISINGGKTERGLTTAWTDVANFPALLKHHFNDIAKAKTP